MSLSRWRVSFVMVCPIFATIAHAEPPTHRIIDEQSCHEKIAELKLAWDSLEKRYSDLDRATKEERAQMGPAMGKVFTKASEVLADWVSKQPDQVLKTYGDEQRRPGESLNQFTDRIRAVLETSKIEKVSLCEPFDATHSARINIYHSFGGHEDSPDYRYFAEPHVVVSLTSKGCSQPELKGYERELKDGSMVWSASLETSELVAIKKRGSSGLKAKAYSSLRSSFEKIQKADAPPERIDYISDQLEKQGYFCANYSLMSRTLKTGQKMSLDAIAIHPKSLPKKLAPDATPGREPEAPSAERAL